MSDCLSGGHFMWSTGPFSGDVDPREVVSPFQQRVYEEVRKIPANETRTYKQIAIAIGHPDAYRAVGSVLKCNPWPFFSCFERNANGDGYVRISEAAETNYVPCHRVVASNPKRPDCAYLGSTDADKIALKKRLRDEEL